MYAILTGIAVFGMVVVLLASLAGLSMANKVVPHGVYGLISWFLQAFLRLLSVYFGVRKTIPGTGSARLHTENGPVQHTTRESMGDLGASFHDDVPHATYSMDTTSSCPPPSAPEATTPRLLWLKSKGMRKMGFLVLGVSSSL